MNQLDPTEYVKSLLAKGRCSTERRHVSTKSGQGHSNNFDECVTVHHNENDEKYQLDATIMIFYHK